MAWLGSRLNRRPLRRLAWLALGVALLVGARASSGDPEAAQPIAFSHRVHARDNQVPCLYCHAYARRGPVAGLPSVQRCAGCHSTIATDAAEVRKLMGFWQRRQPIPWRRVHDLPDYVRFDHKRHVVSGVDCRECHGDVAGMDAAVRVSSLEMGFCIGCHDRRGASTDCLTCHH